MTSRGRAWHRAGAARPAGQRSAAPVAVGGLLLLLGGCSLVSGGDVATWELLDDVTAESRTLEIGVSRLGCAGGVTGQVLEPQVSYEEDRVVIEVDVAAIGDGAHDCQGNDVVPVTVALAEPVAERELVDGACLDGTAKTTSFCTTEVRWP